MIRARQHPRGAGDAAFAAVEFPKDVPAYQQEGAYTSPIRDTPSTADCVDTENGMPKH